MTQPIVLPGTPETDQKKINISIQQIGQAQQTDEANIASNTAAIATLNAATYVNSIAGNSGAFTLNSASGITNATNDIKLQQASSSQFGAVKVDGTTITAAAGVISAVTVNPSQIHASLGADVALNNTANYFDGPSVAQGSTGTWWVSGTVTLTDSTSSGAINCKLWDGTTVIASCRVFLGNAGEIQIASLSGYLATPAGNLRISCNDAINTTGSIKFNASGNSKDSTISAFRIA